MSSKVGIQKFAGMDVKSHFSDVTNNANAVRFEEEFGSKSLVYGLQPSGFRKCSLHPCFPGGAIPFLGDGLIPLVPAEGY